MLISFKNKKPITFQCKYYFYQNDQVFQNKKDNYILYFANL